MHPRNIYRNKPNYEQLAQLYPEFGAYLTHDLNGRTTIDYSNPAALKSLTTTLLSHDFDLDVQIPDGRLIPTLPMRINYLLWVEDLLQISQKNTKEEPIVGLDIGTGCCAIFPLLGVKLNKNWSFIATEIDETNMNYAKMNIDSNNYSHRIKLFGNSTDKMFLHLDTTQIGKVHFVMTNPPFFSDQFNDSFSDDEIKSFTKSKFHQRKICSSCPNEAVFEGGEITFVKKIINESLITKNWAQIYTVMVGRRKSFLELKYLLKDYENKNLISNYTYTELCQGNTKRWAIGWTFFDNIDLTKAPRIKCSKQKPLIYYIPVAIECCKYDLKSVGEFIHNLITNDLHIETFKSVETRKMFEFDIKSNINSWSNQRRKRRQNKFNSDSLRSPTLEMNMDENGTSNTKRVIEKEDAKMDIDMTNNIENAKKQKTDPMLCHSNLTWLLHCGLKIKRDKQQIYLKIETREMSQNKDSTLQIFQYFKNKIV
ncbi:Methyltransferase-like protein 16 [Blomia tropicalis]|nr:Methyltransferase-like protein 16 [Blomia tropicalis]